ncbi:MAG TPA: CDP-diacylglycerol--glycerol-3-phosphate 3-phosphatidyltransferase [Caulobacteraceae bacterium]|nr:CDP-diacylglycerol--glycerol-3-phosphate 3-phosphatidyltransferase [Caulobacteraceae bacterium]
MKAQIPNILTSGRIVLCFLMCAAFVFLAAAAHGSVGPYTTNLMAQIALASFVIAAVTDFFDGYLARRWNVVSTFGAIMDPIADKVLVGGAILGLLAVGTRGILIPSFLIVFREFAVSAMREVLAPRGIKLPVTFLAKTKTTLQLVALAALMIVSFWTFDGRLKMAAEALYGFAAAVTVWTGIEYAMAARKALRA